jgi:hypothetical protein
VKAVIEPLQIVVTNPVYGSIWKPGDILKIKWIASSIQSIDIMLYMKNSFQFTFANNIENNSSYEWLIPHDIKFIESISCENYES